MFFANRCRTGWRYLAAIFIACAVLWLWATPAQAAEPQAGSRTVRVGYYPLEYYHAVDASGAVAGYEIDYLTEVAAQTGWTLEYVEQPSWSAAMQALRDGEIDLLSPAQKTAEREAEFAFSSMPVGKTYTGLIALPGSDFIYEDFEAFSSLTFALEQGSIQSQTFFDYATENGFSPRVRYYDDFTAMKAALERGEVDAMVDNIMRADPDMTLIGKFGGASIYFMLRQSDTDLREELDEAMYEIDVEQPSLEEELRNEYFPLYGVERLTKVELDFAKSLPTLVVGCPVNTDPVCYLDDNGEVAGITRDILDLVAEGAGLTFTYKALPNGSISYDDIRAMGLDLIACVEYNGVNEDLSSLALTTPYFEAKKVIVCESNTDFDPAGAMRIGVVAGSATVEQVIHETYPNFEVAFFDTVEHGLDAILSGEIDGLIQNQYSLNRMIQKPRYENLVVLAGAGIGDSHSLSPVVYKQGSGQADAVLSNPLLLSILNKSIHNLDQDAVELAIARQTLHRRYDFTIADFLYRYRVMLVVLAAVLVVTLWAIACALRLRRRNLQLAYRSEQRLANISKNITGGVLIVSNEPRYPIVYANEGFWHMLEYDAPPTAAAGETLYLQDFFRRLHPDDLPAVHQAQQAMEETASLTLRLMQKDGGCKYVLFNVNHSPDETGTIRLYCVMLDITHEVEMRNQLMYEQKKQQFLVQKAEQLIYEVELNPLAAKTSEAFLQKFGWSPACAAPDATPEQLLALWQVHPEDETAFAEAFTAALRGQSEGHVTVRLIKQGGIAIWCAVDLFFMLDSTGTAKEILGLVRDVDNETRERLLLAERSERDSLTQLYDKMAFLAHGRSYLKRCGDAECALVFLDLDNFKHINDTLGHMQGDTAIQKAAQVIRDTFGEKNLIGRFGGDEFCILTEALPQQAVLERAHALLNELNATTIGDQALPIHASLGIANAKVSGYDMSTLMQHADNALYAAKAQGGNRVVVYELPQR